MEGVLLRPNCGIYSGKGNGNGGGGGGRRVYGAMFWNNDHLQYYQDSNRRRPRYSTVGVRCNKDSVVVVDKETTTTKTVTTDDKKKRNNEKMMKKRLKLVKGLSNDLAMLLSSGGADDGFLLDPLHHQGLREASEVLLSELKKLQSKQKELKKKMKEEKAKCKAAANCTSTASTSSSESSDSECETEVVDMNCLKRETYALPPSSMTINEDDLQPQQLAPVILHKEASILASLTSTWNQERPVTPSAAAVVEDYNLQKSEQDNNDVLLSSLLEKDEEKDMEKKIEVCMGGKCKKSGAGALLEEFQKLVGATAPAVDVVGCKCMGKCREGPNVRLVSSSSLPIDSYVDDELPHHQVAVAATTAAVAVACSSSVVTRKMPKPSYPLCIGVGLEDVGAIVSKLTGDRVPQ